MLKKIGSILSMVSLLLFLIMPLSSVKAVEGIELFTPYSGITVTPGESIRYNFNIMNHTSSVQQVEIALNDVSDDWEYSITSGGWDLQQLSVKPGETGDFNIEINVPLQVEKGTYRYVVKATTANGLSSDLPITITVSEQGTYQTELSSDQTNLEGHSDSTFEYKAELRNRTADEQTYALMAGAPNGWLVDFKVDGNSVTSVTVESNATKNITISVKPATEVTADTYKIPIRAINDHTGDELELEAVITGTYDISLTTPSGKLSDDITAGKSKTLDVVVRNTGTTDLSDITLNSTSPQGWNVTFEPANINLLEAGASETVKVTMEASKNALAGDYVVELTANAPEASSSAEFRMSVKTSVLWGWVGVVIILGVIGGIVYLIRKYGRR